MTAHAVVCEAEEIMASGVDAIVTKPIDEPEVIAAIRERLEGA